MKILVSNYHYNGTNLASSLYEEYRTHFFPVFEKYTHPDSSKLAQYYEANKIQQQSTIVGQLLQITLDFWKWVYFTFPLLKTTLSIFDIPGLIAREHNNIW